MTIDLKKSVDREMSLTRNIILDGIGRSNEDNIEIESVVVEVLDVSTKTIVIIDLF